MQLPPSIQMCEVSKWAEQWAERVCSKVRGHSGLFSCTVENTANKDTLYSEIKVPLTFLAITSSFSCELNQIYRAHVTTWFTQTTKIFQIKIPHHSAKSDD